MITSSPQRIREYTARGWWGVETFDGLLRATVRALPDRLAVADAPNRPTITDGPPLRLTYAELDGLVDAIAAQFLVRGIGRDDVVLVQMPNVVETLATLLACARIGAIASPVAVQYREHELAHIVALLEPKAMVAVARVGPYRMAELAGRVAARAPGLRHVLAWGADLPAGVESMNEVTSGPAATARVAAFLAGGRPSANDVVTICWTSGTEARPKGVPRSHNQWLASGRIVVATPDLVDGEVLMAPFPMVNMASIGGVLVPWLLLRGTMILHHPFDLATFLGQIVAERVTYNLAPPAVLNMLLKRRDLLAGIDLSAMRNVCSGSAPLAPWMVKGWQDDYGICVVNFFGSNEGVALASSGRDVPDPEERARYFPRFGVAGLSWAAGNAISVETRLRDPASGTTVTEPGREGEMCIRGATVFDGYFREPGLTRAAFDADGYFLTGDLFTIAGGGPIPRFYQFVGRCKEIIIRGGQNISLAEVEGLIDGHPGIAEAACVGVPDEILGERLCVVVVPRGDATVTLEDVVAFLKDRQLATYKLPERLVLTRELPRNPVGKVLRPPLRQLALAALGERAVMTGAADPHRLDEAALGAWLSASVPGFAGPFELRKFEGGQSNPTFHLQAASGEYVLRKRPAGTLLPSAHAIDREFRVLQALAGTGVPVPRARAYCDDVSVIGTAFYVMDFQPGRIFSDPLLPGILAAERAALYDAMNDALARLHGVDWRAAGLGDYGRPERYFARQLARWSKQYEATRTDDVPHMEALREWLVAHTPEDEQATIAHGDYRIGNLIFDSQAPRVVAILDWELSTIGHPLSDLAFNCMTYYLPATHPACAGFAGVDITALGIPSEREYLDAYARRTGRDPREHWTFCMAFSLFRAAAIQQGVYARSLAGNASSASAALFGTSYLLIAEAGYRLIG